MTRCPPASSVMTMEMPRMNSSVGHSMPISCTSRSARRDVLAVEPLEEADLRLFARKGADQARAGVVFLRLRGDVGEAGLDALEAVVNPALPKYCTRMLASGMGASATSVS